MEGNSFLCIVGLFPSLVLTEMTPHPGKTHRRPVLHASWPRRIVGTLICLASLAAVVYTIATTPIEVSDDDA